MRNTLVHICLPETVEMLSSGLTPGERKANAYRSMAREKRVDIRMGETLKAQGPVAKQGNPGLWKGVTVAFVFGLHFANLHIPCVLKKA